MIYIEEIKKTLKSFYFLKHSIEILTEKIEEIESELDGFRGINLEGLPMAKNKPNARYEALIIEKDNLKEKLYRTNAKVVLIENALNKLEAKERFTIESFYLGNEALDVNTICEKLNLSKSKLYRLKDQAIKNLSVLLYGLDAI